MARTRTTATPAPAVVATAPAVTAPTPVLSGVTATTVTADHAYGMTRETVTLATLATLATATADSDVTLAVGIALLTTGEGAVSVDDMVAASESWPGKALGRSAAYYYRTAGTWLLYTGTDDYAVGRAALSLAGSAKGETAKAVKAWQESVAAMPSEDDARAALCTILLSADAALRDARATARAAAPKPGDVVTGVVAPKGSKGSKDGAKVAAPKSDAERLHAALPILAAVKAEGVKVTDGMAEDAGAILAHAVRIALAYGLDATAIVAEIAAL